MRALSHGLLGCVDLHLRLQLASIPAAVHLVLAFLNCSLCRYQVTAVVILEIQPAIRAKLPMCCFIAWLNGAVAQLVASVPF
jgi:hypothetical protein